MNNDKLDFIVVGAGKSGTTWLWKYFDLHPECFVPKEKEIHYFNVEPVEPEYIKNPNCTQSIDWYHSFFLSMRSEAVCGEISPSYLWSKTAPQRIYEYNPNIKIIIILRDPVKRAFSQFSYRKQRGFYSAVTTFEDAINKNPFLLERGLYYNNIRRYVDRFGVEQVKVVFYQDLISNPISLAGSITKFLGVSDFYSEKLAERINKTESAQNPSLTRTLRRLEIYLRKMRLYENAKKCLESSGLYGKIKEIANKKNTSTESVMEQISKNTEMQLREYFVEDVILLEQFLKCDLSAWKKG